MRYALGAAVAVALMGSASSAMADTQIGLLECRGVSSQFIVGSVTNLECLFRPTYGGRPQAYDAQIRRFGVDLGFNQSTHLMWSVFAPHPPGPERSGRVGRACVAQINPRWRPTATASARDATSSLR